MKNNASLVYGLLLVVGDFLALAAAFVSAYILRVKIDTRPIFEQGISGWEYLQTFLFLLPFWLVIFGVLGLYNKNVFENRFSEFGRLLVGSFVGILLVISYGYITLTDIFPTRLVTVYGFLLAFFFVLLFRTIARAIRRSLFSFGVGVSHVLIVGDTDATKDFVAALDDTRISGHKIIGIVGKPKNDSPYPYFSNFPAAVKALEKIGIHSVIQTELYADSEKKCRDTNLYPRKACRLSFCAGQQ